MLHRAQSLLAHYFGYEKLRSGQEEAIRSVTEARQNTACIMPTGGGKSICYQIPALMFEGATIVISPLISLMKDQVDALEEAGINAAYINSTQSNQEIYERLNGLKEGAYKLFYITPERLTSTEFIRILQSIDVPLVAIDEAHCISQWGHDFRPSYRNIEILFRELHDKPVIMALTATATPEVHEDICKQLHIQKENTVHTGFSRDNLTFKVAKGENKDRFIDDYVQNNRHEAGIVYTATRKEADRIYERLKRNQISAGRYHGGLADDVRKEQQERFLNDELQVMVATSAFGMGIDKSNIRFVLHAQIPKDMESYYQEAGRAGRDGLASECVLLFSPQDIMVQRFLIEQSEHEEKQKQDLKKLRQMVDYCHTEDCLQRFILMYFGEKEPHACGQCGNCTDTRTSHDVTREAQMVLSCIIRMKERFGKTMVAQVLAGSKNKKVLENGFSDLSTYGILKHQSVGEISDFIEFLISDDFIRMSDGTFPTLFVSSKGRNVLRGELSIKRKEALKAAAITENDELFERLRMVRKEIAAEQGVPPFVVFSDQTLKEMSGKQPVNDEELLSIKGVGEQKRAKYGRLFLQEIQAYAGVSD
ncbi:DNA helicase RecQ [Bacillus spizizenii ATCC 6633 = JCM 2499]|uniref:DNA helicase RecQ n=3 Tax=Bacillus spizizenii TaxID=96241 RepID=E0TYZ2_BACSH|nr:DNA helicase RecQ [Bacillus spizizenii]QCJ17269.1 DNA helicase RecQ [Bacillus subtilis]ADM38099.1 putative ATP-dependent nucleic acid helicase [Bacillus spizizenii str. W23]AJW83705.1 ATP-dependent DNA helicase RecQ [Bacillus spizizenii]EFG93245.1 putative ATP-dependent nucleic acid helicase [Bacillus spizizenii ATCC 6633 = JCM 2499]KFK77232.1 ATP-dependent DNA helicase RecQ [Bacillus spizizenii]